MGPKTLPVDYSAGYDLAKTKHQKEVDKIIDSHRPLLLLNEIRLHALDHPPRQRELRQQTL